jgi:hypothetical protein
MPGRQLDSHAPLHRATQVYAMRRYITLGRIVERRHGQTLGVMKGCACNLRSVNEPAAGPCRQPRNIT